MCCYVEVLLDKLNNRQEKTLLIKHETLENNSTEAIVNYTHK